MRGQSCLENRKPCLQGNKMCIESGQNVRVKFFVEMDFQKEFNLLGPQVEFSLCFAAPYVDAMQKTAESFQAHGGL